MSDELPLSLAVGLLLGAIVGPLFGPRLGDFITERVVNSARAMRRRKLRLIREVSDDYIAAVLGVERRDAHGFDEAELYRLRAAWRAGMRTRIAPVFVLRGEYAEGAREAHARRLSEQLDAEGAA